MPEPLPSLQIATPEAAAPSGLDTVSKFATIQNALNQNRLFQQTFAARQQAGQILATSPDLDTGLANLFKDPTTAAFAPELVNTVRQMQNTMADIATKKQGLAQSGLAFTLHGMASALADPSTLESNINAGLATVDPIAAPAVRSAMSSIVQGLGHGLPTDPAAARSAYSARLSGLLLSSGHTPETIRAITGTMAPSVTTGPFGAGGATVPVVQGGAAAGGSAAVPLQVGGGAGAGSNVLTPGSAPVAGPSQEQSAANEASGRTAGEIASEMQSHAQMLPAAISRINLMTSSLGQFTSGGGADFRTQLGKGLQALQHLGLPITDEQVNGVANGSLPASQVFESQVKPYAVGVLKEVAVGTGKVMKSEVDAFLNSLSRTTDPRAIIQILNQAKSVLGIGYDQSVRYTDFRQALAAGDPTTKGLGPSDFYSWYYRNPKPMQTPPALDMGPTPFSVVRGAAPDVNWEMKGGKLVRSPAP